MVSILFINKNILRQLVFKKYLVLFVFLFASASWAKFEFKDIALGFEYVCTHDGSQVSCWGENRYGQVAQMDGFSNIRDLQTQAQFACALDDLGIMCWGDSPALLPEMISSDVSSFKIAEDNICALIKGRLSCLDQKILVNMPQSLDHISSFEFYRNSKSRHSASGICAIQDGEAFCWNHVGDEIKIPEGLGKIKKIQLESKKGCLLNESNVLTCWGLSPEPENYDMSAPINPGTIVDYVYTGLGGCLNNTAGDLICWGRQSYYNPPVLPQGFKVDRLYGGATQFNGYTFCAFDKLQKSFCWGPNEELLNSRPISIKGYTWTQAISHAVCFELGGELTCTRPTVPLAGIKFSNLKKISSDFNLMCFLDDVGLSCLNNEGSPYSVPSEIKNVVNFEIQGDRHKNKVCAVLQNGDVRCWGNNNMRGFETPTDLKGIKKISTGDYHSCVLSQNGVGDCWGDDLPRFKEMGVKDISVGMSHWCLLYESDEMRCEGLRSDPPTYLTNIKGLISGRLFSCAYSDSQISCWGENRVELGLRTNILTTPLPVGKIRNVSAGENHACFEDDEKVKCWGANHYGQYRFNQ